MRSKRRHTRVRRLNHYPKIFIPQPNNWILSQMLSQNQWDQQGRRRTWRNKQTSEMIHRELIQLRPPKRIEEKQSKSPQVNLRKKMTRRTLTQKKLRKLMLRTWNHQSVLRRKRKRGKLHHQQPRAIQWENQPGKPLPQESNLKGRPKQLQVKTGSQSKGMQVLPLGRLFQNVLWLWARKTHGAIWV